MSSNAREYLEVARSAVQDAMVNEVTDNYDEVLHQVARAKHQLTKLEEHLHRMLEMNS